MVTRHILFICHEYPPVVAGGIGPSVATLARGLARAGHKVSVMGFGPQELGNEVSDGVRIYRLQNPPAARAIRWWVERSFLHRRILDLHRRDPIDVIEWPDFCGWYWKKIEGITDVMKLHGTFLSHHVHGLSNRRNIATEIMEYRISKSIKNWIGVSNWFNKEWKSYLKFTPKNEQIVYNPVDLEVFSPAGSERIPGLVLYAGGLKRRKGVMSLAAAARVFLAGRPRAQLMMIGFESDVTYADIRAAAGEEAARQITFVPYMDHRSLAKNMASASIYAMPSFQETCGNGWVEAAACGVPVIGSIKACGPEIVAHEKNGLLTDPDDPADVAAKIAKLLDHEDYACRLGLEGRKRASEIFSLDVAVSRSEAFYDTCIRDARGLSTKRARGN